MMGYELVMDEPWTFLNARGNPVEGRRLTFQLADGTVVPVDVSKVDYRNPAVVKEKLEIEIEAHEGLKNLHL
ncbi:MAG: hypothetical protein KKB38_20120 [Gammaproteobacteria bacterium]|nr:hypothetical protein [Gammaproteobacteria bacterium]